MGGIIAMVLAGMRPAALAGAVLNDVGPSLAPEGLARIASHAGKTPRPTDWDEAAEAARAINGLAFPHYTASDWRAFARRLFVEDGEGRPRWAYDPQIVAPLREAGPAALAPDLTPLFLALATGRPMLLVHGALSDLIDAPRVAKMRLMAPHMAVAEVPGVGHAPMLDEPEARAALERFMDEAP